MWTKYGPNTIQVQACDTLGREHSSQGNSEEASMGGGWINKERGTVVHFVFRVKTRPETLLSFQSVKSWVNNTYRGLPRLKGNTSVSKLKDSL